MTLITDATQDTTTDIDTVQLRRQMREGILKSVEIAKTKCDKTGGSRSGTHHFVVRLESKVGQDLSRLYRGLHYIPSPATLPSYSQDVLDVLAQVVQELHDDGYHVNALTPSPDDESYTYAVWITQ